MDGSKDAARVRLSQCLFHYLGEPGARTEHGGRIIYRATVLDICGFEFSGTTKREHPAAAI